MTDQSANTEALNSEDTKKRPFIGEIVHFYLTGTDEEPLPAMVTGITWECVHLKVFPRGAAPYDEHSVLSKEDASLRGHTGHFWLRPLVA